MPRILDLQLSGKAFALRLAVAIGSGVSSFLFLYYVPANFSAILKRILMLISAPTPEKALESLLQQFIPLLLPILGLIITALTFLGIIFKNTIIHGFFVFMTGSTSLAYTYTAFQGGMLNFTLPETIVPNTTVTITITLTAVMGLFLAASACNILKGILLILEHKSTSVDR